MVLYTFVVFSVYELKINPTSIEIADKYIADKYVHCIEIYCFLLLR